MKATSKNRGFADSTDEKSTKAKKKKDKSGSIGYSGLAGIMDKFNGMETKSNVTNSGIKALIDVAAAVLIGPALSASLGKFAPLAGIALSFGGHYVGDQSGLMRGVGMSTIAHSLAKTKEYRQPTSTASERLAGLKDDLLRLAMMKKDEETPINGVNENVHVEPIIEEPTPTKEEQIALIKSVLKASERERIEEESVDMDNDKIDRIEQQLRKSADEFHQNRKNYPNYFNQQQTPLDRDWFDMYEHDYPGRDSDEEFPEDFDFNLM